MTEAATRTAQKLFFFAIAMFGFGYAMVPLYDVLCEVTGLNGKTGEISRAVAETGHVDKDRLVTVQFDANVNAALPWNFNAMEYTMKVHPGEISEAIFVVENNSDKDIIGQAVPSVAPSQASLFFNKTECFCFTRQKLIAGERKEMIVRFVVDSELPENIKTVTLSYTFFEAPDSKDVVFSNESTVETIDVEG
jgi:cytochrome c oxidase assembly protein subunit 11